ncbi:MAG: TDT family transporter [Dermatophilaceae bacterium]
MTLETTHRATTSNHRASPSLDRPADAVKHLGPNWFAAVMGTGIVATAAISLPVQVAGQRGFALAVWVVAATLLLLLLSATAAHWLRHPQRARGHISHPVMSHFYGAPPMAMLTVGAGALLVGKDLIGLRAAVDLDWVLWIAGTITGLLSAAIVPYYAFTRHENKPESAFGGWLMPIVPPMVSASTGALLVPYTAAGQPRETLLLGCYVMFGLSLFASIVVITLIWGRLAQHKVGAAAAVPTLWIVLGPLGQSVTAAGLMGNAAVGVLPAPYAAGAAALALFYGLATWGFAMLWLAIAATITVRTAREHLPFTLTWWSFTFPVGTVVMGTSGLAGRTGLDVFVVASVVLYLFLLAAWGTVFIRTTRGAANGHLLLPPTAAAASPS